MMLLSMDWPSATAIIGTAVVVVQHLHGHRADRTEIDKLTARLDALEAKLAGSPTPPGSGPIPPKPGSDAP